MSKELDEKQEKLRKLYGFIELVDESTFSAEKKAQIQEWKDRLEFRLRELVEYAKNAELDIKVEVYEKIVEIVKQ